MRTLKEIFDHFEKHTGRLMGTNAVVLGVSFTEIEAALKIILLVLSIAVTAITLWRKLPNKKDKNENE
jgi:hypothetical protein